MSTRSRSNHPGQWERQSAASNPTQVLKSPVRSKKKSAVHEFGSSASSTSSHNKNVSAHYDDGDGDEDDHDEEEVDGEASGSDNDEEESESEQEDKSGSENDDESDESDENGEERNESDLDDEESSKDKKVQKIEEDAKWIKDVNASALPLSNTSDPSLRKIIKLNEEINEMCITSFFSVKPNRTWPHDGLSGFNRCVSLIKHFAAVRIKKKEPVRRLKYPYPRVDETWGFPLHESIHNLDTYTEKEKMQWAKWFLNTYATGSKYERVVSKEFARSSIEHHAQKCLTVMQHGKYFCPAGKHYPKLMKRGTTVYDIHVSCDRCEAKLLPVAIGYEQMDLCLQCTGELAKEDQNRRDKAEAKEAERAWEAELKARRKINPRYQPPRIPT